MCIPHPFDQFVEQGVTEADIVTQAAVDAVEIEMKAVAESRSEFGRSRFLCHDTRATPGPDPPRDYRGRLPSETVKARVIHQSYHGGGARANAPMP